MLICIPSAGRLVLRDSSAERQRKRMQVPISQPPCSQPFTAKRSKNICAGEMVLLLHWSMLNYAAVVKILKKHGASPLQKYSHRSATTSICNLRPTCSP